MRSALICAASAAEVDRLKFMLSELGFAEFLAASDTDRAVLLANDHLPDLAIIDTDCRGKDLLSAIVSIRKGHPVPVILVANAFETDFLDKAIAAGAGGFLSKPLRPEELWPAIELASVHNHELMELKEKVAELEGALENRKVVERAKGLLMREKGLSEPDAFRRMQKLAMDKRTSLKKVAEAILLTEDAGFKRADSSK
jgi:AmiR/NasT family two-component response regulator